MNVSPLLLNIMLCNIFFQMYIFVVETPLNSEWNSQIESVNCCSRQKQVLLQLVLISDAFEMIPLTKKRNHNDAVTFLIIILHCKIGFLHNSICSNHLLLCVTEKDFHYMCETASSIISSLSSLWSPSAEGLFYRASFVVDDGSMALTQADVERAVALWVRWVRLYAANASLHNTLLWSFMHIQPSVVHRLQQDFL